MQQGALITALPNGITATTQSAGDNTTKVATTAFVQSATGSIRASSDLIAQTTSNANVATYTNGSVAGTFRIGSYLNITAVTSDVIQMQVNYTDENNNTRTAVFFSMGTTSTGLSVAGNSSFGTIDIRVKSLTPITEITTLTTSSGSITYDVGGTITQLR
jgi:hypothetical protein